MKLMRATGGDIARLPECGGACLHVTGGLSCSPSLESLPTEFLAQKPETIVADVCDAWLERLLLEAGIAICRPVDPLQSIAEGAEVKLDLAAGRLDEVATGRRFALQPLPPALLAWLGQRHG